MCDFNGVIVFCSILCPKNLTRVKKKCDLSGAAKSPPINHIYVFYDIVPKL